MNNSFICKHSPVTGKIFFAMLIPTMLMNLTTAIGSMADAVIIGQYLDDLSLSVVTFATPVYMIINMFAALFAVGGCIAMGIDSGKGEKHSANKSFSISLMLLAFTGIILFVTGLFFADAVTTWLGASDEVFQMVKTYSRIILFGGPFFVINIGLAFFVRNDGRPALSMAGMFASIISDIILNFVFVGYLDMGVSGAALSTVIGQILSLVIITSHFFSPKNSLRFVFSFDRTVIRIIKNGASTALHFVYQFITILIINHFLERLAGTSGIVVYTVVFNLSTVSLSVFEGISQTIQPMTSNYFGEKSYKNIRESLKLAFTAVFVICGSVTLILEIFPGIIPVIFGIEDAQIVAQSVSAVRIYAASMIITTVNVVLGYYLQSIEHSSLSAIMISLRSFVLFLGATLILGKFLGMNGVWSAYLVAEATSFVICLIMIRAKRNTLRKECSGMNMLLFDGDIENGTKRYIFECKNQNADAYSDYVSTVAKESGDLNQDFVGQYLEEIGKCISKKNEFIETEINKIIGKIIIRDNLNHNLNKERISDVTSKGNCDYGPVLGWNRMCPEKGK